MPSTISNPTEGDLGKIEMKNGEIQALLYLTYMKVVLRSGPNFLFSNILKTCWEPDEMK